MAKKKHIPQKKSHKKDPKRVLAGKARAAKSLRVDGRFTTNKFFEAVKKDADFSGVKDVFKFFLQAEKEYIALYFEEKITFNVNEDALMKRLAKFSGSIYVNKKRVSKATAVKGVAEIGNYLRNEHSVHTFYLLPYITLAGTMGYKLPSVDEFIEQYKKNPSVDFVAKKYGLALIYSDVKNS